MVEATALQPSGGNDLNPVGIAGGAIENEFKSL